LPRLANDTGLSLRAVRYAIQAIEQAGHLTRKWHGSKGTTYRMNLASGATVEREIPASGATIEASVDDVIVALGAPTVALGASIVAIGAAIVAPDATKQSITSHEPTKEPVKSRRKRLTEPISIPIPEWVPGPAWNDYLENRIAIGYPLTVVGMRRLLQKLSNARDGGANIEEMLNESTINGYRGVFEPKARVNGQRSGHPKKNAAQTAFEEFSAELDRMEAEKANGH
jgi:hypothetical protein